ncbi:MAG: S-adenosylmethionine:tRNA ribosyltransferase-isomerase [Ferruginibacter sp.]
MPDPRKISIQDFTYSLPEEKIALHPLPQRDASKLLVYKNEKITEDVYSNIATHLPAGSLLVFNNTKVINARLRFQKISGGIIEIFCLEPYDKINEYSSVMNKTGLVRWKCFVGGAGKWKEGLLEREVKIKNEKLKISAGLVERLSDAYVIEFSWTPSNYSFAEVIESVGDIPLPPYIKRTTDIDDVERYQTIYAKYDGSVAAPTAGLHFTENIFEQLALKNIEKEYITLHVGAGTFKPVKSTIMNEHEMHAEWIDVSIDSIRNILHKKDDVIAVGTTSTRTIETLYWLGVKTFLDPSINNLDLKQWDVYELPLKDANIKVEDALNALINWMKKRDQTRIFTQTQLLIAPGYTFKIVKAIITNFHQPQSTLLLLVAAATKEKWRAIYDHALQNNFRFLSYGDGNLIFI